MSKQNTIDFIVHLAAHGRQPGYAVRRPDGTYYPRKASTFGTNEALLHLNGEQPAGIYLVEDDETNLLCLDFDDHDGTSNFSTIVEVAKRVGAELTRRGYRFLAFRSGGGRGIHIFVFFAKAQKARAARTLGLEVLAACGLRNGTDGVRAGAVEVFPKQDRVAEGKLGNLVALPLARQSRYLDPHTWEPLELEAFDPPVIADFLNTDAPMSDGTANSSPKAPRRHLRERVLDDDLEAANAALKFLSSDEFDFRVLIGLVLKTHFGEDGFDTFDLWSTSSPKYLGEDDCRKKWDSFNPDGSLGLGTLFYHAREKGWNGPGSSVIREMNAKFGILINGNSTQIIRKRQPHTSEKVLECLGVQQFHDLLVAETTLIAPARATDEEAEPKKVSLSHHWFKNRKAARYEEVIFDPSLPPGDNGRMWNIWQGFAFDPVPGDWSLLREHIYENICGSDPQLNTWMLNWMALGVQKPAEVIGTSPVLLGPPGVGKSFLAECYGALWGNHFIRVTSHEHVFGRFNAHRIGKRFVFIDEGLFGGNRKEAGVIKTLVTERFVMLEQKGIDPIPMRNRGIFMVASNEQSVVPADIGDRRWMVLEVSHKRAQDRRYFRAIAEQMNSGGYGAMLHDLLDPSNFLIRTGHEYHMISTLERA